MNTGPKSLSKVLSKTSDSWNMGTLRSCIQRMAQSRATTKSWEVISAGQLISISLGIGKAAKINCRQLINSHTLTQSQLKEQGSVWVQRILKIAEGLQATSVLKP